MISGHTYDWIVVPLWLGAGIAGFGMAGIIVIGYSNTVVNVWSIWTFSKVTFGKHITLVYTFTSTVVLIPLSLK